MAIKELFFEGKTIDAAVEKAAEHLGKDKDLLSYTVEETPTRGIFGIGATPAKIRVEVEVDEPAAEITEKIAKKAPVKEKRAEPKAEQAKNIQIPAWEPEKLSRKEKKPATAKEEPVAPIVPLELEVEKKPVDDEVSKQIIEFLSGLLTHIGADEGSAIEVTIGEENHYYAEVSGARMGILIGRRGETLDAAQYLCGLVINKGRNEKLRITLDTENYRAKRIRTLQKLAEKNAEKAIKYKRNITMEPMSPYERRIIHATLTGRPQITTFSVGSEPNRKVVVSYKR